MPVIDRFSGILCGVILIVAVTFIFAPRHEAKPA